MFLINSHRITAAMTMSITMIAIAVPIDASAQSLFGGSSNYGYHRPDPVLLGLVRAAIMAVSFGFGYLIGWLLSPESKEFRKIALTIIAGGAIVFALASNSLLSWSLTSLLAFVFFFVGLGYWLGRVVKKLSEVPTTFGSACWAKLEEIVDRGLFAAGGIRLGQFFDGEIMKMIAYHGDRHGLLVGPTRSEKGTSQIIPNLLTHEGSVMVIDVKGENALITAQARKEMGQEVLKLDPWGIASIDDVPSVRFNPIDWVINSGPDSSENAMILSDALVARTQDKEAFWDQASVGFLQGAILYVAMDEAEDGQRHLPRVRDLMMLDGDDLKSLFQRMLESPHHVVAATGARMLQMDEKLLANVMASVQSHTQFLDSPRLRESLSVSDFRFEDMKSLLMSVYIVLPADRLKAFAPWLRLIVQQAITVNARNIAEKPEKPILFILDEMATLGHLTMVEQAYGLMAGFGMQLYGVVQDLSQLKRIYGDGFETFIGNSGLIQYFGSRDRMTAEYFSALCGEATVWNLSSALSRTFGTGSGGTSSSLGDTDTTAAAQRKLAYPDELMRLPNDKQLIFVENMNPIIATKVPWFKDEKLKGKGVSLQ